MEVAGLLRGRKGQPPERVESWYLEAGDPGDERQISLLPRQAREAVERMEKRGLCMKRFFANLEITGLPPLEAGDRLAVGGAVVEITRAGKKCFPECPLALEGAECPLRACRFARVVRGGAVSLYGRVWRIQ